MSRETLSSKSYTEVVNVIRLRERERHIETSLAIEGIIVSMGEIRKARSLRRVVSQFGVRIPKVKVA